MKNGIEFKSEKQVAEFYKDLYTDSHTTVMDETTKDFVSIVKSRGYIKKSALEEAREYREESRKGSTVYLDRAAILEDACDKYEKAIKELQND